jgi:hypothetical protein
MTTTTVSQQHGSGIQTGSMLHDDERAAGRTTLVLSVLIFGLLLVLLIGFPLHVNFDVAFLLDTGNRILDGQLPYVDIFEVNLPVIFYVNALPVWISRSTGTNPIPVYNLLVFLLTLYSATMVDRAIAVHRITAQKLLDRRMVPILYGAFSSLALSTSWGQREHLLILILIPWLLVRWLRLSDTGLSRWLSLLLGVFAGIAFMLKPHYVFAVILPEVILVFRARTLRVYRQPEILGAALVALVYVAYVLVYPQIVGAYLNEIIPFAARAYDALGRFTLQEQFSQDSEMWGWVLIATAAFLVSGFWRKNAAVAQLFAAASLGSIIGYIWQGKGWSHHQLPAEALTIWLVYIICLLARQSQVLRIVAEKPLFAVNRLLVVFACVTLLMLGSNLFIRVSKPYDWGNIALIRAIERYVPGDGGVLMLDPLLYHVYPTIVQAGHWQALHRYQTAGSIEMGYYQADITHIYDRDHVPPPFVQDFLAEVLRALEQPATRLVIVRDGVSEFASYQVDTFRYLMARPAIAQLLECGYIYTETIENARFYLRRETTAGECRAGTAGIVAYS